MSKSTRRFLVVVGLIAVVALGGVWLLQRQLAPMEPGPTTLVRFERRTPLGQALHHLAAKGIVRSATAMYWFARITRQSAPVAEGTYQVAPGMDVHSILSALRHPLKQMVRIPEFYWIARTAALLEERNVCKAADYIKLTGDPQSFQSEVSFPLPASGSLEGYLYPDTYDLPPLLGARQTIVRQLRNFEKRVGGLVGPKTDMNRLLTVASLVQLEVARDGERPIVAGVIENRLRLGMRLQIDATSLYCLGTWKNPSRKDLIAVDSPYNTYLHSGLPPGPICSPTVKSVQGALRPATHNFLFYVALPTGQSLFAPTLAQHNANIRRRRLALQQAGPK